MQRLREMEDKARFVFPIVITTAIIVFVVSGAVTFFNIGWRSDFDPMVVRLCHRLADCSRHRLSRDPLRPQLHPAHRRGHRKDRLMLPDYDCDLSSRMGSSVRSRSCPPQTPRGAWPALSRWHWR